MTRVSELTHRALTASQIATWIDVVSPQWKNFHLAQRFRSDLLNRVVNRHLSEEATNAPMTCTTVVSKLELIRWVSDVPPPWNTHRLGEVFRREVVKSIELHWYDGICRVHDDCLHHLDLGAACWEREHR